MDFDTVSRNTTLSRGFDAGNHACAYKSEDLGIAWASERPLSDEDDLADLYPDEYRAAFVIGFFSSFEENEISEEHVDEWREAMLTHGPTMKANGIAVGWDEMEQQVQLANEIIDEVIAEEQSSKS